MSIRNSGIKLHKQKDKFKLSLKSDVKDPLSTIKSFNSQFQLNKYEQNAVNWGISLEFGYTMFHIVNAYTRGAQFKDLNAESSYRLQKVGGNILGMLN